MDHREALMTAMPTITASSLSVKIFADGADLDGIRQLYADPLITGFTTNPTLMRRAGITDYERFARELLEVVPDRPISFEVFSDEPGDMERQARRIASWGDHVYVKIPVTYTSGERTEQLLRRLCDAGVKINVTGLTTVAQVEWVADAVVQAPASYVSVFAGRIADTGVDPVPLMSSSLAVLSTVPTSELIWASPRELLNIVQADQIGCHIITVTHDLLKKLPMLGKDLDEYSLDTVRMFHGDAAAAGFEL
jgi:transaldolase